MKFHSTWVSHCGKQVDSARKLADGIVAVINILKIPLSDYQHLSFQILVYLNRFYLIVYDKAIDGGFLVGTFLSVLL